LKRILLTSKIGFPEIFIICVLFPFAPHAGAGHFLSLRRQRKEAKKGDCGRGFAAQTSLTPRNFSGGLATCGCAASNMQALISRKTALRSAASAEGQQDGEFVVKMLL